MFAFVTGVAACNAVLDIPAAGHLTDGDGGASSSSSSGKPGTSTSSSGNSTLNCGTGKKECNGACVSTSDPATGCEAKSCDPCSLASATARCAPDGSCAVSACKDGFKDCNNKSSDGCEVDINTDTQNCGDCNNPCDGSLTCANGGCGCDTQIQCGLQVGGDQGQISCDGNRQCTCFGDLCDPGSACDINNSACDGH